ncbi:hypothetical protein ACFLTH_01850 [Bacteroidota bacterium]
MRKIIIISLLAIFSTVILAQSRDSYSLLNISQMLNDIDLLPSSNSIEEILVVGDTIWLASSRGLSKSGDDGESWTNYGELEEFDGEFTSTVEYNNGIIWTATLHVDEIDGTAIGVGSGLRYSRDNGNTWTVIEQPIDLDSDNTVTYGDNVLTALPITVPEENFIYDVDFTSDAVWIASRAAGLRKSTDMGQTWQRVVLPPDYLDAIHPDDDLDFELSPQAGQLTSETNLNHIAFSVYVLNDTTIFAGTSGGFNISTDGGISWRKLNRFNQDNPISGNQVLTISYDEFKNTIWASTWKTWDETENWGVSSSSDGGETWEVHLPGEKSEGVGFKYIYNGNLIVDSHVIVTSRTGLFGTTNGGKSWIAAPYIYDEETNLSLAVNYFRTADTKYNDNGTADIWVGSLNGLARLRESTGFWQGEWEIFFVSRPLTTQEESYTFPNPFHPGRDVSVTRFKYSTGGTQSEVTIRIFDFGMNLVRTVIQNATRSLTLHDAPIDYWDGRDDKSRIVPNGVYFYRIDINSNDPLYGKILVVR